MIGNLTSEIRNNSFYALVRNKEKKKQRNRPNNFYAPIMKEYKTAQKSKKKNNTHPLSPIQTLA